METIGDRIKAVRKERGYNQTQLAKKAGSAQSTISMLERGERTERPDIIGIAHALGVDAYWLKTGKGQRATGVEVSPLSQDQQALIDAWGLIDPDTLDTWVSLAKKKLEQANEAPPEKMRANGGR